MPGLADEEGSVNPTYKKADLSAKKLSKLGDLSAKYLILLNATYSCQSIKKKEKLQAVPRHGFNQYSCLSHLLPFALIFGKKNIFIDFSIIDIIIIRSTIINGRKDVHSKKK